MIRDVFVSYHTVFFDVQNMADNGWTQIIMVNKMIILLSGEKSVYCNSQPSYYTIVCM